jgi:hypothetical protein
VVTSFLVEWMGAVAVTVNGVTGVYCVICLRVIPTEQEVVCVFS